MVSSTFIATALSVLSVAAAQNTTSIKTTGSAVSQTVALTTLALATASGAAATQTVAVGQNGLVFAPESVTAKVGDTIVFQFYPKNHSIVQADFASPCVPKSGGLFSGFIPSAAGAANRTFSLTVMDLNPIWYYCSQNGPPAHCQSGMVGVINPPATGNTLAAFKAAAAGKQGNNSSPTTGPLGGSVVPAASLASFTGGSPSATASTSAKATGGAAVTAVSGGLGVFAMLAGLLL